jgi:hypothetical protein
MRRPMKSREATRCQRSSSATLASSASKRFDQIDIVHQKMFEREFENVARIELRARYLRFHPLWIAETRRAAPAPLRSPCACFDS